LICNLPASLFTFLMAQSMVGGLMNGVTGSLYLLAPMGQQADDNAQTDQAKSRQLLELHTNDAASFSICRDVERTQKLELKREPVDRETNLTRVGHTGLVGRHRSRDHSRARGPLGQSGSRWVFGAARVSDMNLLSHKNHEVWSSIRSDENTFYHDAKHRLRFDQDRAIPEFQVGSTLEVK
jgi:hypothetical protein